MPKKIEAFDVYALANFVMSDSNELATFNMLCEIYLGKLRRDDGEEEQAAEQPDAEVVGYYAYIDLNGRRLALSRVLNTDAGAAANIDKAMCDAIMAMPPATDDAARITMSNFPCTMAALIAWHHPERGIWYAAYRHPDIPHDRVGTLLQRAVSVLDTKEENAN